jgi:hypothetical protein
VIKKYKYLIGIFIIIFISVIAIWQYYKKENIYLLYNSEVSDCKYVAEHRKKKHSLCYNGMYLFEKIDKKPIVLIDNLNRIKLTSKKTFFTYFNHRNINIFLVIKKGKKYEVLPVKAFQILS